MKFTSIDYYIQLNICELNPFRVLLTATMLVTALPLSTALAQPLPAYNLLNGKGKRISHQRMIKELTKADIVLFGEQHNNSIAHWLQLEVTRQLGSAKPVILGAEMFEADNQHPLDQYLKGEIDQKGLDTLARLWQNYSTDYAPLVAYAKDANVPFIATNVPRRHASLVYKKGFEALDSLAENEKAWIAPLPIKYDPELPQYIAMLSMMGGHGGETLPMAQAIKDATMAYFILKHFEDGKLFLHFNGAYHSDRYEGILWYLKQQRPELSYATISTVVQSDITKLEEEHTGKADFIICVDEDVPGSY